jgi:hypothetical protein
MDAMERVEQHKDCPACRNGMCPELVEGVHEPMFEVTDPGSYPWQQAQAAR